VTRRMRTGAALAAMVLLAAGCASGEPADSAEESAPTQQAADEATPAAAEPGEEEPAEPTSVTRKPFCDAFPPKEVAGLVGASQAYELAYDRVPGKKYESYVPGTPKITSTSWLCLYRPPGDPAGIQVQFYVAGAKQTPAGLDRTVETDLKAYEGWRKCTSTEATDFGAPGVVLACSNPRLDGPKHWATPTALVKYRAVVGDTEVGCVLVSGKPQQLPELEGMAATVCGRFVDAVTQ
jgi:hypothetical protein